MRSDPNCCLADGIDTNSLFLSDALAEHGIEVRFKSVVGDDVDDIGVAVTNAAKRVKLVLITGGLGPTVDDVTREAVARITGKAVTPSSQGAFDSINDAPHKQRDGPLLKTSAGKRYCQPAQSCFEILRGSRQALL